MLSTESASSLLSTSTHSNYFPKIHATPMTTQSIARMVFKNAETMESVWVWGPMVIVRRAKIATLHSIAIWACALVLNRLETLASTRTSVVASRHVSLEIQILSQGSAQSTWKSTMEIQRKTSNNTFQTGSVRFSVYILEFDEANYILCRSLYADEDGVCSTGRKS